MKSVPVIAALALVCATNLASAEAERVGTATRIQTAVNGDYGTVEVKEPVHRDERIVTSKSGLGEFLFRDGSKLAVGAGSVVKIDKYVFDDSNSVKKLSIKAAKGTFRWISGNSVSTAYSIVTPAGTIGVRGTKFDFYVGPDGRTGVVLLSGSARFCGSGGCVQLLRKCDCVIAKRGQRPALTRASRKTLTALGNTKALPFLSGNQQLSGGFGSSVGCGMNVAAALERDANTPEKNSPRSSPSKPDSPGTPSAPNRPDTPSKQATPNAPSNPGTPNTPNTPDPPDTPSEPGGKRGHGYGDKNHSHTHDPQGHAYGGGNGGGRGHNK
ncbi:MAG: FecR domain-containing protein [Phyllobacterium sp.]|uniref:FecR family protein n=1 Tax=Phyllobacterium sp. TaxID=1871046 RepID=UPI0030EFE142